MFELLETCWVISERFLSDRPWLLFGSLVFLPGFPVPVTAILILIGAMWADRPLMACGLCVVAMGLNMCWTYWLSAGPGRAVMERVLRRWNVKAPEGVKSGVELVLLMRLTPGMPFFVQNYVLGFMQVPFRTYLPLSLLCNAPIVVGIVLSGAGLVGGNVKPLIAGVGLLVVAAVLVRRVRQKLAKRV